MKMASDNDLAGMEVATNRPHDSHRRMSPFFFRNVDVHLFDQNVLFYTWLRT